MLYFHRLVFPRFRLVLLAVSVLLVLGLNQRTVSILRPVTGKPATGYAAPLRAAVVKQKVTLEATASLAHFVAPLAVAWLPPSAPLAWLPALQWRLAAPRPLEGVRMGEAFCRRLLAVALSPQAP